MLDLFKLVLQIAVILACARVMGILFRRLHQPQVVGEMFAGILLGPSLLGRTAPDVFGYLFPAGGMGALNALSQVGLLIFMFLIGLELDPKELKTQGRAALLTSHVGIAVPMVLSGLLAYYLYPRLSDSSVSFTKFALFLGAAMSITAFPVLARILAERNMLRSRLGTVAIACAAVGDVTGWCILAYIVVMVRSVGGAHTVWLSLAGVIAFALIMIYGVRRLLRLFESSYRAHGKLSQNLLGLIVLLVLVSALFTDRLGIHLLFGAFLFGAIMPKEHNFVRYIQDRFETITVTLLLPLFFAFTGLRTSIGLVQGREMWMYCGLIILVATIGKLGGSTAAAWLAGMPIREATGLGVLMNARGLMELVILNIGLDIKVISPALFSMMVVMALVTTFMTTPLLELVYPARLMRSQEERERATRQQASFLRLDMKAPDSSVA